MGQRQNFPTFLTRGKIDGFHVAGRLTPGYVSFTSPDVPAREARAEGRYALLRQRL